MDGCGLAHVGECASPHDRIVPSRPRRNDEDRLFHELWLLSARTGSDNVELMASSSVAATRSFARKLLAAGVLATTASCTLLVGIDGLAGPWKGTREGGAEEDDVMSTGDGSATNADGSLNDAGDVNDGASRPFCSGLQEAPTFCEDFDHTPFGAGWVSEVEGEGTLAMDDASAVSRPSSRRVTVAGAPRGTPCRYINEQHSVGKVYATRVRVEHDLLLGHLDDTTGFPLGTALNSITVSAPDGTGPCQVYFDVRPGGSNLIFDSETDRTKTKAFPLSVLVQARTWTHVALEIRSPMGSPPQVNVVIDGNVALANAPIPASLLCKYGRLQTVTVGFFCFGGTSDVELRVDNLAAWTE